MQRVSDLVWHLLIASSLALCLLILLLHLTDLFHLQFLSNLLLGCGFNVITLHSDLSSLRPQVVLRVINSVLAIGQSVNDRLNLFILGIHLSLLGPTCVLVSAANTSPGLRRFAPSKVSLVLLVSIQSRYIVHLLLLFQYEVCFYESFNFWLSDIVKPAAGKAIDCCEPLNRVERESALEKL